MIYHNFLNFKVKWLFAPMNPQNFSTSSISSKDYRPVKLQSSILKVSVKHGLGLGLGLLFVVGLQGCSTIDSSIAKVSSAYDRVELSLQSAMVEIEVEQLTDTQKQKGGFGGEVEGFVEKAYGNEFILARQVNDTATDLDNRAMHAKSKSLCEKGYVKLSQQAVAKRSLKDTSLQCVSGDCRYQLNWHIRCQDVPEQPFSLFGKS